MSPDDSQAVRRVWQRWLPTALALSAALLAVAGGSAKVGSAADPTCTSTQVCVSSGHRPDPVGASTSTTARNVAEDTTITNGSAHNLSLVEFVQAVPAGFTFVEDALGACTASAGTVTCVHGQVVSGQTVANTLVYRTPVLASGTQQTTAFQGTWCWAGCDSHAPGAARVDSLDLSEPTTVTAGVGFDATYLLAGNSVDLSTGAAATDSDRLVGTWTIPGQARDLAATTKERPNPPGFQDCPPDGKLCRAGDWFAALSPGTLSFKPYSTVVFDVFKKQVPAGTTESNYEVQYTPCLPGDDPAHPDGCPVVRLSRCTSEGDLRCTEFVTKLPGGNYRVGVRIGSHNGYMK